MQISRLEYGFQVSFNPHDNFLVLFHSGKNSLAPKSRNLFRVLC